MKNVLQTVLVTGGAGFIGSAVCRHLVGTGNYRVVNLDKLTYAGNLTSLRDLEGHPYYAFRHADICDTDTVRRILADEKVDLIMHLAAESHVDRSIDGPMAFVTTNVVGTASLLSAALDHWRSLGEEARKRFRFHHVSTDEVFGDLPFDSGVFTEESPYKPSSPYSASKAASDHFVRAWHETYGLPVVLSNCSNNYGPYHFPEKLIPLVIANALDEQPLPVYGKGANIRDWLLDLIVVTHNSGSVLSMFLETVPSGANIVVVDNASADDSAAIAEAAGAKLMPISPPVLRPFVATPSGRKVEISRPDLFALRSKTALPQFRLCNVFSRQAALMDVP